MNSYDLRKKTFRENFGLYEELYQFANVYFTIQINGDDNLGCVAEEDEGEAGSDGAEVVVDPSKISSPDPQNNRTPEPPKLHSEFIKSV